MIVQLLQPYDPGVSRAVRRAYLEWYRAARNADIRRRMGAKPRRIKR